MCVYKPENYIEKIVSSWIMQLDLLNCHGENTSSNSIVERVPASADSTADVL